MRRQPSLASRSRWAWIACAVLAGCAAFAVGSGQALPAYAALSLLAALTALTVWRLGRARRRLSRVERDLESRMAELETLHSIGREVAAVLGRQRIFAVLERECRKIFDFDCCLIVLLEGHGVEPYTAFRHRRRRRTELGADRPVQPLIRWAADEKRGRRVDDVTLLPGESPLRGPWLAPGTRSLLVAPLIVEQEVTGLLVLENERPAAFDEHQLNLLTTVAQLGAIAVENARHYQRASVDSLTGLYAREFFFSRLEEEDERARRYGGGFALLMIDLDGFKEINDRAGHLAGDQYLSEISGTIRAELRGADVACRFGGDEFCLLLPQTGVAGARAIAERIRDAVSRRIVAADGLGLRTTASIGLAAYPEHGGSDLKDLLRKADEALYRAKRAGRDQVVLFAA